MPERTYTAEQILAECLAWRGIEPGCECKRCGGSGTIAYGSTSTWHGGAGGMTITGGVCDKCWGSGEEGRAWPSHRKAEGDARRVCGFGN